ncbi:uncharacterized protein LOC110389699 [Numida meleagris]|uniref:uncharacterized protein LOC110389699 n=1 Tax=Numida meleagris TaxID=8996 RepID=UPI000B3D8C30|nr:uncharacterized protein LOC110389699 [Numida meleagris]
MYTMWHTAPEEAANFVELGVLKPSPSLSFESLMHFLNAHLTMLSISLNALLIILVISLSIYFLRKPSPKPEDTEWQGVWRKLGETLERWESPVSWNFTPEHMEDPESLSEYLRQRCDSFGESEEAQIIWGLAHAYRALFNTIPERERQFETKIQGLQAEIQGLQIKIDCFQAERESFQKERESFCQKVLNERESLQADMQSFEERVRAENGNLLTRERNLRIGQECLQAEKEILQAEKEDLRAERDNLQSQENIFQSEWYTFQNERDTLQSERDTFQNERDTLQSKLDCLQFERDTLQSERDTFQNERDTLQSERDTFQRERDTLQSQLNRLQTELHALQSNFHAVTEKLVQAELERQSMKNNQPDQPQKAPQLISVAPVRGRKVKRISLPLEQETAKREGPGEPPQSPGEGPSTRSRSPTPTRATTTERDVETLTTCPLKMTELRVLRKDFTQHPGERIVTWLLRCWDSGANSALLDSTEACQLGSIARDSAIDRDIRRCQDESFTLWKRMLLAVKEKYPFKNDLMPEAKKWTTMEKGIQYLRECAVVEMLHDPGFIPDDPNQEHDPERIRCTPDMWHPFTRTAPEKYAGTLSAMYGRGERRPPMGELISRLHDFEIHLTPLQVYASATVKVTERLDRLESDHDDIIEELTSLPHDDKPDDNQDYRDTLREGLSNLFSSQLASSNISATIRRRHPPAQASDNSKTMSRVALWRFLRDHGEDMKKWHKKPTPALQAWATELLAKSITKAKSSAPVAAGCGKSRKGPDQKNKGGNK